MQKMKKYIFAATAVALAMSSCDDSNNDTGSTAWPNSGVEVTKTQRVMLVEYTDITCAACPAATEAIGLYQGVYDGLVNHIQIHEGDDLYNWAQDSIASRIPSQGTPTVYVNEQLLDLTNPTAQIEGWLSQEALIGLSHSVVRTDSAYVVYPKVKFFQNLSASDGFSYFIQSYALYNIDAKYYGTLGVDLNQASSYSKVVMGGGSTPTKWTENAAEVSEGVFIFKSGDTYQHMHTLLGQSISDTAWGWNMADINPLGANFFAGDIYGTQYTPIVNVILKDEDLEALEADMSFITIIWKRNADGHFSYVNSYQSSN